MFRLSQLNPTRRLVGRLFLWFWATFLLTALLAAWLGRMLAEEVDITTPTKEELALLQLSLSHIEAGKARSLPLAKILKRADRRHRQFVIDLQRNTILWGEGPPPFPRERDDLIKLSTQSTPIVIQRGGMKLIGPLQFDYQGQDYALYTGIRRGPPHSQNALWWVIVLAMVITIALSYWFAKSLVKPILQLQQTSQQLAKGNLQARVNQGLERQDELGWLARDFNSMAEQLERLWTAQKRLLADISHELRSPLARLQMAVGLAHQQNVDPGALRRIEREAERMESLISQLLQLARAEADAPEMEPVMLSELLDDLLANAHFEATNRNKHFEAGPVPASQVVVNSDLLCSAVENVVRNAIHYADTCVQVAFSISKESWQLTVTDDGPGLSEQECQAVFAPFYRASLARDRESGGVGLGLAIAKKAVELHHGRIRATPQQAGGLAVTLSFPVDGRKPWSGT